MNGRGKSIRLCVVFVMAGVLTVMCLTRTTVTIPTSVSHYLDIVIAILMVVLMLCVLELCLGVELCSDPCCCCCCSRDAEAQDRSTQLTTPDYCQAPPSYEVIMMQGGSGSQAGGSRTAGRWGWGRGRGGNDEPLKRDFSVYFKRHLPEDYITPPMRPFVTPGASETSIISASELWLTVDGLPTYEEAVARLREEEEEMVMKLQEEVAAQREEEEARTRLQEEGLVAQQTEEAAAQPQSELLARHQDYGRG
ncbi:uncharacterized protein LOC123505203 isoform X2 [Portunus trituberculatus]|uniref:uncharacterized protein LOC123505203 isoform X2 n=1 Tax=Portunus trituberculatus TaxID=210409 RepID=UPI001E1D1D4B|nr:uncharacterized protein LOC123505203 isoform X2 [Portunus trituberculatus]XP_045112307.1 uncharacterized protein LOC123505203 isoform X2 [Portunus trituberculatus]XP_045112308.1 uncharacterized protein LOC123505203 isoform X2 [Portunus trituberculatus]XP_045112309.1 uncharacterized protein LOC123505203 isoform X2 [Portunus trituberculatus]XP_045112310.1 uncharacterized protein LOC123505203 isoform X2 [Portunus trituberculatus]XP_045112311.1 uncharacterized protein LOC123505203 isoform X2 [P